METIDRASVRLLAVAYHAYMTANADNWQPWAKLLIKAQRDTGIELLPVSTLLYEPATLGDVAKLAYTEAEAAYCKARENGATAREALDIARQSEGDDASGDGGALVPAPTPPPRKPSPGAVIAAQAAKFYANKR